MAGLGKLGEDKKTEKRRKEGSLKMVYNANENKIIKVYLISSRPYLSRQKLTVSHGVIRD